MNRAKVILFGGNGFVGTAIAEELVHQGVTPVCVSRTGSMPIHLQGVGWAQQAVWVKGDALQPDPTLFNDAIAVITLIGSPPVPTFSKKAYDAQLKMNCEPNLAVIKAAAASSVSRLVLLGAHLPKIMQTDKFGYAKGKRLCEEAAREFVTTSNGHTAVVLKPTAIYGTRYSKAGKPMNIDVAMRPIAKLQSLLPANLGQYLPETLVSVEDVGGAAVRASLNDEFVGKFTVLTNRQIIQKNA